MSLPTFRQASRSVKSLTDRAQALVRRRNSVTFIDAEQAGDHLSFAHQMSLKARRTLVRQGICKQWQTDTTRATVQWEAQLNASLTQLFLREKAHFSVQQLFTVTPIWIGDLASKMWRLELDTGMMEIVIERGSDGYEEKRVCLTVGFALPETVGCVRVEDVEREAVDEEDWTGGRRREEKCLGCSEKGYTTAFEIGMMKDCINEIDLG
jgi:hypothetical protein